MRRAQPAIGASLVAAVLLAQNGTNAATTTAQTGREPIFDVARGLVPPWTDLGWAPRQIGAGQPLVLDLSGRNGWITRRPGLTGPFGGIELRVRSGSNVARFLEVSLDGGPTTAFPVVALDESHLRAGDGGWVDVFIPMRQLNPGKMAFDRVFLRSREGSQGAEITIAEMSLVAAGAEPLEPALSVADAVAAVPVQLMVDCGATARPVSPRIFGIAWKPGHDHADAHQWLVGATARRFGGNPTSRYNWSMGNAWNTAGDWFFMNVNYSPDPNWSWRSFLDDNRRHGVATALTVPMLGWVAKDTSSYSYPVSVFGPQQSVAPENPDAGDGRALSGEPIAAGPPVRTSVASTPEDVAAWVEAILARDRRLGEGRSVDVYILDNEPMLWNETHRDVHPQPVSYDELLRRTIAYAAAVRAADPEARIAGPALWGWPAYVFSAVDAAAGFTLHPDRLAHGNQPLLPWWLQKVHDHERRTGVDLLDVVDVHFYPQGDGIGGEQGGTDPETAARRIRSTRALWDPTYVDESWIAERIELIPRLQRWIDAHHPAAGIQIGEYNFGAEDHMSGALALAEALGRFAEGGVEAAYYWNYPPEASPAYWAFRAYRDFDGEGGRFLDSVVPTVGTTSFVSLFASIDEDRAHAVLILLNLDPDAPLEAHVDLGSCGVIDSDRVYSYQGGAGGPRRVESGPRARTSLRQVVPGYSITVLDLELTPPSSSPTSETTEARQPPSP